jgi:4-amino-4-deoxy-L-arabinose transferase-like glycosyltransferase
MEGHPSGTAAQGGGLRRDLALVALLLLTAVTLRAWHLRHTEVAARDSIGFIRYAWQLAHHPWTETIGQSGHGQHPGYPVAIVAMSGIVRWIVPGPDARVMQLSAQLVSCTASVLLVVPMFLFGRDLFGRSTGFWAALIFQCLPAAGCVFADGLSEGLFLLLSATALLAALRAFRGHAPIWFALTGLFGGLAYLTRPEGALTVAATGLVLLAVQCSRSRRASWRRFLACGTALAATAIAAGCPIVVLTGKLIDKPTPERVLGEAIACRGEPPAERWTAGAALPFAIWLPDLGDDSSRKGCEAVVHEFVRGGHYISWLPMLLGVCWFRDRLRLFPGAWVALLLSLAIVVLMWRVASLLGYVSDRHLLLPLLCGTCWAVAFVPKLVTVCAAVGRMLPGLGQMGDRLPAAADPVWATLLLAGFAVSALPKTLEPLHANRKGFREAGLWIAERCRPWDEVEDPYAWSHYYAGKVFVEDQSPAPPPGETKVRYVVIEVGRDHPRIPGIDQAIRDAAYGKKVWERVARRRKDVVDVTVYEVPVP